MWLTNQETPSTMSAAAASLAREPRQFYSETTPPLNTIVVATITRITDTAVYCELPAFCDMEAMIPISEIHIKRHRRVTDYVKPGQNVAAQVLRHDPLDLSLKIVRADEREEAFAAFARDGKIHQIARNAAAGSATRLAALLTDHIWPRGDGSAIMEWMKEIRGGTSAAAEGVPPELARAIFAELPEPSVSVSEEIILRFGAYHDGVHRLNALIGSLAALPGVSVLVTAPPKFQLTATASNRGIAEEMLAAAKRLVPAPC